MMSVKKHVQELARARPGAKYTPNRLEKLKDVYNRTLFRDQKGHKEVKLIQYDGVVNTIRKHNLHGGEIGPEIIKAFATDVAIGFFNYKMYWSIVPLEHYDSEWDWSQGKFQDTPRFWVAQKRPRSDEEMNENKSGEITLRKLDKSDKSIVPKAKRHRGNRDREQTAETEQTVDEREDVKEETAPLNEKHVARKKDTRSDSIPKEPIFPKSPLLHSSNVFS